MKKGDKVIVNSTGEETEVVAVPGDEEYDSREFYAFPNRPGAMFKPVMGLMAERNMVYLSKIKERGWYWAYQDEVTVKEGE
jgi:hypothetical protein